MSFILKTISPAAPEPPGCVRGPEMQSSNNSCDVRARVWVSVTPRVQFSAHWEAVAPANPPLSSGQGRLLS